METRRASAVGGGAVALGRIEAVARRTVGQAIVLVAGGGLLLTSSSLAFALGDSGGNSDAHNTSSPYVRAGMHPGDAFIDLNGTEVNAFNFNYTMAFNVPIGPTYPENAGVTLQLARYYNSRIYSWEHVACEHLLFFRIRRENPMGLGFEFGFGRIIRVHENTTTAGCGEPESKADREYWAYVAADGAVHKLMPHAGDEFRSHDGSHIKAVQLKTSGQLSGWSVYFSDGTVREMLHEVNGPAKQDYFHNGTPPSSCPYDPFPTPPCPNNPYCVALADFVPDSQLNSDHRDRDWVGWYTTRVYSQADISSGANQVSYTVEYQDYAEDLNEDGVYKERFGYIPKRIVDQFGRTILVTVETNSASVEFGLIKTIEVPAPSAPSGAARTRTYQFEYEQRTGDVGGAGIYPHTYWVLTHVGSSADESGHEYVHEYTYREGSLGSRGGVDTNDFGGEIETVIYPTGHAEKFAYFHYSFESVSGDACDRVDDKATWTVGISKREVFLDGNVNNAAPENVQAWTFSQAPTNPDQRLRVTCPEGPPELENYSTHFDQLHTMIDPSGVKTQMIMKTGLTGPDATTPGRTGDLLTERYWEGPNVVKEVQYEQLRLDAVCNDVEWSPKAQTTTYTEYSSGGNTVVTVREDHCKPDGSGGEICSFDPFGRPQETTISGNGVGDLKKVVVTDYASDNRVGGDPQAALCASASELADRWLGDVVASEAVYAEDSTGARTPLHRTVYGYNADRGTREKTVSKANLAEAVDPCEASPPPSAGDVVTTLTYSDKGDVAGKSVFIAGASGPAATQYNWSYGFNYGALAWAKNGALPYYDFARIIDPASGRVVEQRIAPLNLTDTNAVTARWEYNLLGWVTKQTEGTQQALVLAYENEPIPLTGGVRPARVRLSRGTGDQLTESVDHYDVRGRLEREEVLRPSGTRAYRHTRYDNAGRVSFKSEWTAASTFTTGIPGTTTEYQDPVTGVPDPFGRPRRTVGALGNDITRYEYFGTNKRVTVDGVATGTETKVPLSVTTTYFTDGLGNLRAVDSQEGADAVYSYDLLGRMRRANLVDALALSPTSTDRYSSANGDEQVRTSTFDALGRLGSSTHPERGTIQTLSWDALGQPLDVQDALGAARGHLHRTTYDIAGRKMAVDRVLASGQSPSSWVYQPGDASWTTIGWDTANSDACLGQAAWYHGGASCTYAQSAIQVATLTSPSIGPVAPGTTLSFEAFREVRSGGAADRLIVLANQAGAPNWQNAKEIYRSDSSQVSWARWQRSAALPLEEFAGQSVQLQFKFESVSTNPNATLRGIGIGEVAVRRPASVPLVSFAYDETFGVTGNRSTGKITSARAYDEGLLAANFTRTFEYAQTEGLLSRETFAVDWDRDGISSPFEADFFYDAYGNVMSRHMPHPVSASARGYTFTYRHGGLVGIESFGGVTSSVVIPDSTATPGFEYELSGAPRLVRFANGTIDQTSYNVAWLPQRIWVEGPGMAGTLFDTGIYSYDGARNVEQIGGDLYRYDGAQRLTWARVSAASGSLDLDQQYDLYGNMTAQTTTPTGGAVPTPSGPAGLHFTGRTYGLDNRITNPGFAFDANGALVEEPLHDGVGGFRYSFSPESRLSMVHGLTDGKPLEEAQYDGDANRWVRQTWADGGKALLSFRDASGQVTADYLESAAESSPQIQKEYIHANGRLVSIASYCGPRPDLDLDTPAKANGNVRFVRTDNIPSQDGFTILIQTAGGQRNVLTRQSDLATHFEVAESELFPYDTNLVSIETNAECGSTGHSNAVSYAYVPSQEPAPTCLTSLGASRIGGVGGTTGSISLQSTHTCASGTGYIIYFWRLGDDYWGPLNTEPQPNPNKVLSNQPAGTGYGRYWVSPVIDGQMSLASGPPIDLGPPNDDPDSGSGGGSSPLPTMNLQFVHADHLGSTRLITDERGVPVAQFKFYPFGLEAESTNGADNRFMFTGHERDTGLGLDYMMARYHGLSLNRFLSADPYDGSVAIETLSSWNRYSYVSNNPLSYTDPSGMETVREEDSFDGSSRMDRIIRAILGVRRVGCLGMDARKDEPEPKSDDGPATGDEGSSGGERVLLYSLPGPNGAPVPVFLERKTGQAQYGFPYRYEGSQSQAVIDGYGEIWLGAVTFGIGGEGALAAKELGAATGAAGRAVSREVAGRAELAMFRTTAFVTDPKSGFFKGLVWGFGNGYIGGDSANVPKLGRGFNAGAALGQTAGELFSLVK